MAGRCLCYGLLILRDAVAAGNMLSTTGLIYKARYCWFKGFSLSAIKPFILLVFYKLFIVILRNQRVWPTSFLLGIELGKSC